MTMTMMMIMMMMTMMMTMNLSGPRMMAFRSLQVEAKITSSYELRDTRVDLQQNQMVFTAKHLGFVLKMMYISNESYGFCTEID